jgi:hypothetical protein
MFACHPFDLSPHPLLHVGMGKRFQCPMPSCSIRGEYASQTELQAHLRSHRHSNPLSREEQGTSTAGGSAQGARDRNRIRQVRVLDDLIHRATRLLSSVRSEDLPHEQRSEELSKITRDHAQAAITSKHPDIESRRQSLYALLTSIDVELQADRPSDTTVRFESSEYLYARWLTQS